MEISFKRVSEAHSSKPPITYRTKKQSITVAGSGPISSEEAHERMQSFFRENTAKQNPDNIKNNYTLDTSKNDVFILRGKDARSAKITKQSYDELYKQNNDREHNLMQINLQPVKAKKQAAIYFDTTAMQGRKIDSIEIDKSQKGRVKLRIKTLDLMA